MKKKTYKESKREVARIQVVAKDFKMKYFRPILMAVGVAFFAIIILLNSPDIPKAYKIGFVVGVIILLPIWYIIHYKFWTNWVYKKKIRPALIAKSKEN